MDGPPDYRRRRIGVACAALALLIAANHERPAFGTISITVDSARPLQVEAKLAPPFDMVATAMAMAAAALMR